MHICNHKIRVSKCYRSIKYVSMFCYVVFLEVAGKRTRYNALYSLMQQSIIQKYVLFLKSDNCIYEPNLQNGCRQMLGRPRLLDAQVAFLFF